MELDAEAACERAILQQNEEDACAARRSGERRKKTHLDKARKQVARAMEKRGALPKLAECLEENEAGDVSKMAEGVEVDDEGDDKGGQRAGAEPRFSVAGVGAASFKELDTSSANTFPDSQTTGRTIQNDTCSRVGASTYRPPP